MVFTTVPADIRAEAAAGTADVRTEASVGNANVPAAVSAGDGTETWKPMDQFVQDTNYDMPAD